MTGLYLGLGGGSAPETRREEGRPPPPPPSWTGPGQLPRSHRQTPRPPLSPDPRRQNNPGPTSPHPTSASRRYRDSARARGARKRRRALASPACRDTLLSGGASSCGESVRLDWAGPLPLLPRRRWPPSPPPPAPATPPPVAIWPPPARRPRHRAAPALAVGPAVRGSPAPAPSSTPLGGARGTCRDPGPARRPRRAPVGCEGARCPRLSASVLAPRWKDGGALAAGARPLGAQVPAPLGSSPCAWGAVSGRGCPLRVGVGLRVPWLRTPVGRGGQPSRGQRSSLRSPPSVGATLLFGDGVGGELPWSEDATSRSWKFPPL